MANPFGEIAGKIAGEVAEGLAKKAAPVVVKTAKKAVKAVEDKADDWGFKGGKPGEMSGTEFVKKSEKIESKRNELYSKERALDAAGKRQEARKIASRVDAAEDASLQLEDRFLAQLERGAKAGKLPKTQADNPYTGYQFARLESLKLPDGKAGLPRRLTGKVFQAFGGKLPTTDAKIIEVAREIDKMTPGQLETMRVLSEGWTGTADELIRAAKNL